MASEPNSPDISSVFENRDYPSLLMPFLFGFSNSEPDPLPQSANPTDPGPDRIVLVNPFTQSIVVIEGRSSKEGQPPASAASIQALSTLRITEQDLAGECVICLEDWEIGAEAKELPCKHKFHSHCVEKWLGFHGSCPVCRFELPVDGSKNEGRRVLRGIWVGFSFNSDRRSTDHDEDEVEG